MKNFNINISKIKAAEFKQAGFKSKITARKFAQLLNIKTKGHETASSFLKVLETKLKRFKDIGMDFNESLKDIDTSSSKVKKNRIKKQENKPNHLKPKLTTFSNVINNDILNYMILHTLLVIHFIVFTIML